LFPDSPYRIKIDLAGAWEYSIDKKTWSKVEVPSCYDYSGKIIFQRSFDVKAEYLDKYTFFLVAYGINYQSEVTINGDFIGRHIGGANSFILPIPNNTLQLGSDNSINISVNSELTPRTTLPLKQHVGGWKTYGGIFRDIYILAVPKFFIEDASTISTLSPDFKTAKLNLKIDLTDRWSGLKSETGNMLACQVEVFDKLTAELVGRSGLLQVNPKTNKTIFSSAEVQITTPKLWSPETPDLYTIKCQLVNVVGKEISVIDEFIFDHGFREIKWKEGKLSINDKIVPLKGILWREDHETFGAAISYDKSCPVFISTASLHSQSVRSLRNICVGGNSC
jgi:beta-galactosidase/beta-glucuronidase